MSAAPTAPRCAKCGNDGTEAGLYLTIDARWQPAEQAWELIQRDDSGGRAFDCLACDHSTLAEGPASFFPYGKLLPAAANGGTKS